MDKTQEMVQREAKHMKKIRELEEELHSKTDIPEKMYMFSIRFDEEKPILSFVNKKSHYDAIEAAEHNHKGDYDKVNSHFCGEYTLVYDDEGNIGYSMPMNEGE